MLTLTMPSNAGSPPCLEGWGSATEDGREALLEQYRPLAMGVLHRLGCGQDEDLRQVALLGLVRAIERFDPDRGISFSSYAWPTVAGEVKRYLRDHSRFIRPPRSLHDGRSAVLAKAEELTARAGSPPTLGEVAEALEMDLEGVVEVLAMDTTCQPASLDSPVATLESEREHSPAEMIGTEDPELERAELRSVLQEALATLEPKLQSVIALRYDQCLSQRETGEQLGVSQMQVSRLERHALTALRSQLAMTAEEALAA